MMTLEFAVKLTRHPLTILHWNAYEYNPTAFLNIFISSDDSEIPYILKSNHLYYNNGKELVYSVNREQFRGRIMTIARVEEIMNTSKIPIIVKLRASWFLVGKGFLARYDNLSREIDLLFVACCSNNTTITDISQVKYYISRNLYLPQNKSVASILKSWCNVHKGDIVITSNINKYIGHNLCLPKFNTISDRKKFTEKVMSRCINELRNQIIPPTGIDSIRKEATESTILVPNSTTSTSTVAYSTTYAFDNPSLSRDERVLLLAEQINRPSGPDPDEQEEEENEAYVDSEEFEDAGFDEEDEEQIEIEEGTFMQSDTVQADTTNSDVEEIPITYETLESIRQSLDELERSREQLLQGLGVTPQRLISDNVTNH